MIPAAEPHFQLLQRAYCYLRLCGVEPTNALRGMRSSLTLLTESAGGGDGEGEREAIWAQLEALAGAPQAVPGPPLISRGHMGYPP